MLLQCCRRFHRDTQSIKQLCCSILEHNDRINDFDYETLLNLRKMTLKYQHNDANIMKADRIIQNHLKQCFNDDNIIIKPVTSASISLLKQLLQQPLASVQPIQSQSDLERRIDASDRRIYALLHRHIMPDEALCFLQVAYQSEIPATINDILYQPLNDGQNTHDVCVFYSLSVTQMSLKGVEVGSLLFSKVYHDLLHTKVSNIYTTLSPIPAFRSWLQIHYPKYNDLNTTLHHNKDRLTSLCIKYIHTFEDPVARFHMLKGGARFERVNWMGDERNNMNESYGFLSNYVYYDSNNTVNRDANRRLYLQLNNNNKLSSS